MTKNRIEWTGDTSTVAFVFNFIGDYDPEDVDFPAYQAYEKKHPGALLALSEFYMEDEEAWTEKTVVLTDEQVEQLLVYIACVNEWFVAEQNFFLGMNPRWRINDLLDAWDPADEAGSDEVRTADDWWRVEKNANYIVADVQDRIESALGEDSYLFQKLLQFNYDELMEIYSTLFIASAPYDYDLLWLTNDDDEVDIPEDELDGIEKFFASNVLLIDFKYASVRYRRDYPKP
jgi:hypothetical protein